jgi:proteasome lid subunit RPN8/RPN11
VQFGDARFREIEAFVACSLVEEMGRFAYAGLPNEAIGILAGRSCCDERGVFTVVEAVELAVGPEQIASPGAVTLTPTGSQAVRRRLAFRRPTLDPVGWFHTHTSLSVEFSGEDRREQATWPDAHNLGIVFGAGQHGDDIAVYAGPESNRLWGALRPIEAMALSPDRRRRPRRKHRRLRFLRLAVVVFAGLAVAGLVVLALVMRGMR